jgi:asparagine synthase (glutamine-hydrolysing)
VSVLNHLPTVDAFSIVTDVFPEFDERKPIESFLQRYPQVRWHEVNCDRAWALSEPWERLPVTDDPLVTCTLPMNLQVMERIQQQGFGLVFNGEWGDELFYGSIQDLARVGNWQQVLQHLRTQKRWHSTLWHELGVPRLPQYWQSQWFARLRRKSDPIPRWITPSYVKKPQTQAAIQQYFESFISKNLVQGITSPIEDGGFVAISQIYRLLRYAHQLDYASPLQDQRLVEFAINLHPSLQNDPVHEKVFLRQANRRNLPADVLWRPKTNYFDPLKYAGIAKGHQAVTLLEQVQNCPCLQEIVDVGEVKIYLNSYRNGYAESYLPGRPFQNAIANRLYILFAFVNWYQRLNKHYILGGMALT